MGDSRIRVLTGGLLRKMYGNEGDVYKYVKCEEMFGTKYIYPVKISAKEGDSALTFSNHGTCQINDIDQREEDS